MKKDAEDQGRILSTEERERFGRLFIKHQKKLRTIMNMTFDLSRPMLDEIIQDACANAMRKLEQLQDDSHFLPWMVTITKREFYASHRRLQRQKMYAEQYCMENRSVVLDRIDSFNPYKKP